MSGAAMPIERAARDAGYAVADLLGRGRNSSVWLAHDARGGRTVALKVASVGRIAKGASPFAREYELAGAVSHPNVMRVFGHGVAGGFAFLCMEHAQSGTLRDAMRDGPMAPARVLAIVEQAAGALAQLHRAGLVHRDVKPANFLVRAGGELALGDFGCACAQGHIDACLPGTVVGSPRYAAPEQSCGAPAHPAADVYSLGVILYEMLSGRALFPGETLTELASQHALAGVPRLPADCAAWQALLDAMLAKDAGSRPCDACAVLEQLRPLRAAYAGSNEVSRCSS
jgi:eukaryotic-like serine/threonine-protein kinase